jgi:hypothetical protein
MPNNYGGGTAINESSEQLVFSSEALPPWAIVNLAASVPFSWECFGASAPWATTGGSSNDGVQWTASVFAGWTLSACLIYVKANGQAGNASASFSFFNF